jgi:putative photosynthetic complex assembly protein 2
VPVTPTLALLGVVAVWWVGTGVVFVAARAGTVGRRVYFAAATLVVGAAVVTGAPTASQGTGVSAAVGGLLVGFAAWAWVELSFYTGMITGPSRRVPPGGAGFGSRFRHALLACLWHELAIAAVMGLLWVASPGPQRWAVVQFGIFWVLHEVARLNVLVGVPHPFRELLPEHLAHLQPYCEPRPAGGWLYLSIAGLAIATAAAAALARISAPQDAVGWSAAAVLLGLGVIELGVLLFPVPLARLWQWFGMDRADEVLVPRV